jgi:hypothetical protein
VYNLKDLSCVILNLLYINPALRNYGRKNTFDMQVRSSKVEGGGEGLYALRNIKVSPRLRRRPRFLLSFVSVLAIKERLFFNQTMSGSPSCYFGYRLTL